MYKSWVWYYAKNFPPIFPSQHKPQSLEAPMDSACCISSRRKIFPAGDFGIVETKATRRTFLYGATCHRRGIKLGRSGVSLLPEALRDYSYHIITAKVLRISCIKRGSVAAWSLAGVATGKFRLLSTAICNCMLAHDILELPFASGQRMLSLTAEKSVN